MREHEMMLRGRGIRIFDCRVKKKIRAVREIEIEGVKKWLGLRFIQVL